MSGTRVWDSTCYIAEDDSLSTTTSDTHTLIIDGDTVRLSKKRSITSSNDSGYTGEISIGQDNGVSYIYYCTATDTWQRCALSNF